MSIDIKLMGDDAQPKINVGDLLAKGWTCFDLPKMHKRYYDYILASMGEGEVYSLTVAKYVESDGEWWRGQIIYSPQAKINMQEYKKTHPVPD